MKTPRWFPHPIAWINALLLRGFAFGFGIVLAMLIPVLLDLARHSPRLGWLGILGLWASPLPVIALFHHVAHAVMDLGDSKKVASGIGSWFAGLFAWATFWIVTTTTGLILIVIDPPPVDPDGLSGLAAWASSGGIGLGTFIWIVLAAGAFHLERLARPSGE